MKLVASVLAAALTSMAWGAPPDAPAGAQPRPQSKAPGLAQADRNGDGKVSFEELAAVRPQLTRERFQRLDRNGDGVLSPADRPAGPDGGPAAAQGQRKGAGLERFQRADVNGDRQVTFQELSALNPILTQERFKRLDTNGDGVLSRADAPQGGGPGMGPGAGSGGSARDEARRAAVAKLLQGDTDKDGKVTYDEALQAKPGFPREAFDRFDTNHDGVLSSGDTPVSPMAAVQAPAPRPEMAERLRASDADGDGRVSLEEAQRALPRMTPEAFKRFDRNGDGYVSKEDRPNKAP